MNKKKSKFGLDVIDSEEKTQKIQNVFSSVATTYDLMNDLMSLGSHRIWKHRFFQAAQPRQSDILLDIASGTGDIAINFARACKGINVTCLDANKEMLTIAEDRFIDSGIVENVNFIAKPIEKFKDLNNFTLATIVFGFRNFTDQAIALQNIYKSLKPGGKLVIMDFKSPSNEIIRELYEKYTDFIIPKIGKYIAGDERSYQYLSDSIKTYIKPNELSHLIESTNFENVTYETLPGDIVTIHKGYKI
tara:strand:- start:805 stop:1545 length:741 start_codon:yes stop_codon:yes gene_type:complete